MPARIKPPWHRGTHHQRSARIRAAAYADPATRCWRCGRTLAEIQFTRPRARWQAGHLIDGQVDGELAPECSPCNAGHGASLGNRRRGRQQQRTELTW